MKIVPEKMRIYFDAMCGFDVMYDIAGSAYYSTQSDICFQPSWGANFLSFKGFRVFKANEDA